MADNNTTSTTEQQRVKEITDKLEEGLKELFESEKYRSYLNTMSKFHNYSFNNTLLIAMQKPEASLVAGYKAWQKNFDRHVNKGEKAIRILAPAPYKIKEERDKLDPVTGELLFDENGMPQKEKVEITIPAFRAVSVFDVSQMIEQLPEMEVRGSLEKWLAEEKEVDNIMKLATEIDQYAYDFDTYEYRDSVDDRQAQIESIAEDIRNGNTEYLSDFLNAAISNEIRDGISDIFGQGTDIADSESVQNARRAKELLDKLAEYKPLAKIEEQEEQNFNMMDNVLNNGAGEKALKEERRKEQDGSAKPSLKARLAEKQLQVSGKGQQHEEQENTKKNHRDM